MAQTNLNIRMDSELQTEFTELCDSIGIPVSTVFCVFAKKAVSEQRLPLEFSANDPFYSEKNMQRLRQAIADVESGVSTLKEHDLIEVDDE